MTWQCKLCAASFISRALIFKHYRLQHSHYSKVSPLPCPFASCVCTFHTLSALSTHLSRHHSEPFHGSSEQSQVPVSFKCLLCTFQSTVSESVVFGHLRKHLKNHETVSCPYNDCSYRSNVYSSFNSHKSRAHQASQASDFKSDILCEDPQSCCAVTSEITNDLHDEVPCQSTDLEDNDQCDSSSLKQQLKLNVSSLFLKMQAILHVSNMAVQEIVDHLNQTFSLSQPLIKDAVNNVLQKHGHDISQSVLDEIVSAVMDSNVLFTSTSKGADLSSSKRRKTFFEGNYPCVMPIEYQLEQSGRTIMYVPILSMIQALFKNTDILKKISEPIAKGFASQYASCSDGSFFIENELLSAGELTLPLQLYIDDLEIANPLGTSRKIHKICAVYWVIANVPPKYRSTLHAIQLALLVKVVDLQKYGYATALSPLLHDINILEKDGVFIESVGQNVKGTIFCVSADNLAAHGLAGFVESFRADYCCRFCEATSEQYQETEVREGEFIQRTKASHDMYIQTVEDSDSLSSHCGVKGSCALHKSLDFFHPVTGFPPDILHDLLEGIIPVELALCLKKMIGLKYFTLEYLNERIASFPYQHTDKVDRPQPIPKTSFSRGTIGGNGHENATLLRLLPLLIGSLVPEGDAVWAVLMELKEITELALCPSFTDETLDYFECKISDHRQVLKEVFPEFRLRPKHHYVEHYPTLTKCFGPLLHVWTMRFEAKHRFFKRVVHDAQNFKNILKTMAIRHQHMMAYHLAAPSFFHSKIRASRVDSALVSALPEVAQVHIRRKTTSDTVYQAGSITIDGTDYVCGMFLSIGSSGGLSKFSKIEEMYLLNQEVSFLCSDYDSWYLEHLRSYELSASQTRLSIYTHSTLNDTVPLSAYKIHGVQLLTPKRFIQVKQDILL